MRRPAKVSASGRVRTHFDLKPDVYEALKEIAQADRRSMLDELSYLVMERKRLLDVGGEVGEEFRER